MAKAVPCQTLNNGHKIPMVGLGTWQSLPGQVENAVKYAFEVGYRHVDCSLVYQNEAAVGEGIKAGLACTKGLKREDIFVTSKLWNTKHHPDDVEDSLRNTLKDLKLDYLDLYLMHFPIAFTRTDTIFPINPDATLQYEYTDYKDTWRVMEKMVEKGLTKSIGLANFNRRQIDDILSIAKIKPVVLQVECHPYLAQNELIAHCHAKGLVVTAYSPLVSPARTWKKPGEPDLLEDPCIVGLAKKYGKSPAQIVLRWQVQRKVVVIPKSVTPARILQNIQLFDFSLAEEDMKKIGALNTNTRYMVPEFSVDGKTVRMDPKYPYYPFNDPY
ncbi:aldo-keto reductase family 1 member A1-like [Pseudophryne corroboree]|uniref:aldo-keto reductase family 1 member A1-like n=1 Tax=Pseudophryne corroboree TaxID=495146 RepID=UPI0030820B36